MTLTAILAMSVLSPTLHGDPLVCPVMGAGEANHEGSYRDYNGARYWFCCSGCDAKFEKEPKKYVDLRAKGKASGASLFDPVSGARLPHDKAIEEFSDYKGVRYLFANASNKAAFDKEPAKFGATPQKEALFCPVGKEKISGYEAATGFVDYKGVRYYTCCSGCGEEFKASPTKYVKNAEAHVKTPSAIAPKE